MRILVTGYTGQLGYDVVAELKRRKIECVGATRRDFSLADVTAARGFIIAYRPGAVIHCAAYTAVDKAEDEPEVCRAVNAGGAANIARACREIGAKLLYISTDYVFPGKGAKFYETNDPTGPLNVYGRTKLEGELAIKAQLEKYFIVRTSWVFGRNGGNFVETMLRLGQTRGVLDVVADQIGSPTYTSDLARLLGDMALTEKYGVYHATNEGVCSWAQFARAIFRLADLPVKVNGVPSETYPVKAKRPLNSRLSKASLDRAGFSRLPDWRDALGRYLMD